ncbi:MAG: flagellar hook assembly protein FlgD [Gammaproteobacteria bacterium]|nr:flagellar hook assembly protein FlgD [Gammaproteobacteria bacterium]
MSIASAVNPFERLGLGAKPEAKKEEMGRDDFMTLLVTQLKNQDPLKPMENTDFIAQLAQFTMVDGVQEMRNSFGSLSEAMQASQALQGASLLGRYALAQGDRAELQADGGIVAAIDLPASAGDVTVEVQNAAGQTVRTLHLGPQPEGLSHFGWDGVDAYGNRAAPGSYTLRARTVQDGKQTAVTTLVAARVDTVSMGGASGLVLNLAGLGPVSLNQVRQIM